MIHNNSYPGNPYNKTLFQGDRSPVNSWGYLRGSMIASLSSLFASSKPTISFQATWGHSSTISRRMDRANVRNSGSPSKLGIGFNEWRRGSVSWCVVVWWWTLSLFKENPVTPGSVEAVSPPYFSSPWSERLRDRRGLIVLGVAWFVDNGGRAVWSVEPRPLVSPLVERRLLLRGCCCFLGTSSLLVVIIWLLWLLRQNTGRRPFLIL